MSSREGEDRREAEDVPEVGFDVKERAMDEAPVGITISDPDRPDNPLVYVNDAFEHMTGYSRGEVVGRNCRFLQGEGTDDEAIAELARGIDEGEVVTVELLNYRKDGEAFWNEVKVAPVENEAGEVTNFVGFQTDVTERKRAELAVKREREHLDHLLDRINGLLGDVTLDVVSADGRAEIERTVCEHIAAVDPYSFAWIGESDLAGDRLRANAWAGDDARTAEDLAVDLSETDHPGVRAVETGETQVLEGDAATSIASEAVRGIAAVPLVYRETTYGVLVVYTPDTGALNEREVAVLESLGRTVATACNAHESKRILTADNVVEIELEVRDRGFFVVDLSSRLGTVLEYRGSVYRGDSPLVFFATDADPAEVLAAAEEIDEIDHVAAVGDESDATLFEFRLAAASIVSELADRGARTRSIAASDGTARIEFDLPASGDARALIERFEDRYPRTELVGYHETERPPTTKREFVAALEEDLTDRQYTALQKAYVSGYYEWNRTTSGDELADSMGISRSTFHQHLRAAERKLVAEFFDR